MEDYNKQKGQVLDLLRSWEHTNQYEKTYFLLLHILLFLIGLYFIRNKFSRKNLARPDHRSSQFDREGSLQWASNLTSWLIKNSSAMHQAMDNWRLKLNGRLLKNCSKGNLQIVEINYSNIDSKIIHIKSLDSNIENEMNISLSVLVKRLGLTLTQSVAEKKNKTMEIILHDLNLKINVQFCCLHDKIKFSYKLAGILITEQHLEFKNKIDSIEGKKIIIDALNAATKDTMILEVTRGILKKEFKTQQNSKSQSPEEVSEDSPKHILVTDLDTAMEKLYNQEMEKDFDKATDGQSKKCQLQKLKLNVGPKIVVLPATPLSGKMDNAATSDPFNDLLAKAEQARKRKQEDALMDDGFEDSNYSWFDNAVFKPSPVSLLNAGDSSYYEDSESDKLIKKKINETAETNCAADKVDDNEHSGDKSNYTDDKSNDINKVRSDIDDKKNDVADKKNDIADKKSVFFDKKSDDDDKSSDMNENKSDFDHTKSGVDDKSGLGEEDVCLDEKFEEFDDKGNDMCHLSQFDKNIKPNTLPRPKSICSPSELNKIQINKEFQEAPSKRLKNEINRVNTFHFGSKSMASIVTDEGSPYGSNKRSSSQLSLSSPVGYNTKKPSALIIETEEKTYYHIPPIMARKGNYNKNGTKLHVYNGHIFVAQHFNKIPPACSVCSLPLTRRIGKQGYQCRDCNIVTHKRCHNHVKNPCKESSFPSLNIEYLGSTDV